MTSGTHIDNKVTNYQWSEDMSAILDKMRINCIALSDHHKYRYTFYKDKLILFRFPIILLSGVNTFAAVGLIGIADQVIISITTSIISLICGIITSLELYLNYQKKMENELISHKEYYRLSVEIFKVISLDTENRKVDGKAFLEEKFSTYEKLLQSSNVVEASYIISTLTPKDPIIMDENGSQNNDVENQYRMSSLIPTVQSFTQPHLYKLKQKNRDMEKSMRETTSSNIYRTTNTETRKNNQKIEEIDKEMDKYKGEIEDLKNTLAVVARTPDNYNRRRRVYYQGQSVEGNYRSRGRWYPGRISQAHNDGTYDVEYDDGEFEKHVDERLITAREDNYSNIRRNIEETSYDNKLKEGSKIEGNYRGRGRWYPARVSRKRLNDTFDIDYDDGEKELGVNRNQIRLCLSVSRRERSESHEITYKDIPVGTKIEAQYNSGSKWFPGKISSNHGNNTYDITYNDGDMERNVKRQLIRVKEELLPPAIPDREESSQPVRFMDYDIKPIVKIQRWYKKYTAIKNRKQDN